MSDPTSRSVAARHFGYVLMTFGTVLALLLAAPSRAAVEEIEATGRYYLGDNDTRLDGHRLALMEAKRNALEKAGTYVESITEVKDFQLTRDDVKTYTAGIIEVTEPEEPKWEMVGQTLRCTVKVKAQIDKDDVAKRIAALRQDKEATQQLKEERHKTETHEQKVAELNKKLKKTKKGSAAAKQAKESRDNELAGVDAATVRAQAIAAKTFSKESWEKVRGYVNNNVNLKGCMPFKTAETAHGPGGTRDAGLLIVAAPAFAFAISKPRKKDSSGRDGEDADRQAPRAGREST